jgi:Type IV pilin-like G and H, putative
MQPEQTKARKLIHQPLKVAMIILVLSPFLFLLQQVFSFATHSPNNDPKVARGSLMDKAEANIGHVIRAQRRHVSGNGAFGKTFDEIFTNKLKIGADTRNSYQYIVILPSQDIAAVVANPFSKDMHSYNGATWKYKNTKGVYAFEIITCKSKSLGADGTEPSSLPLVNASRKLSCAPDWTTVYSEADD